MSINNNPQVDLTAVLNLVPYLDVKFEFKGEITLENLVLQLDGNPDLKNNMEFATLKNAVEDPEFGKITLVNQSSIGGSDGSKWKDDLIQGCTFRDNDGNYHVAFRGTGDGRWVDNAKGMTMKSTPMQEAAQQYFDSMAEKYFLDAHANGKQIIVTGHSKGGNEAQYVYMNSEYEHIIDKCYSFDGQGFSEKAIKHFKEKYGDEYEEKLKDMYSINGTNDYVHDLGYPIIPEENTYFVGTAGDGFKDYHALGNMIGNGKGSYEGLQWKDPATNKPYEQGEVGKLAKELSAEMMKLDDEDLDDAAVAIMSTIDAVFQEDVSGLISGEFKDKILGENKYEITDYIDLLDDALPAVLKTMILTEAGREFVGSLIIDYYQKNGLGKTIGLVTVAAFVIASGTYFIKRFHVDDLVTIIDFVIDQVEKIQNLKNKIKNYLNKLRNITIKYARKIAVVLKKLSYSYRYATENPVIRVDTYKLDNYAQRLDRVNRRLSDLDRRLDSLYWKVGLKDLWSLMQADLLTGYSGRIRSFASYLRETADDFEKLEKNLVKKL